MISVSCAPGYVDDSHDVPANTVNIAKHIIVPKPKDLPTEGIQPGITLPIADQLSVETVLRTIEFDNQPVLWTCKIDDEPADRHLTAKPQSHEPVGSQLLPEFAFCIGHAASHSTGI